MNNTFCMINKDRLALLRKPESICAATLQPFNLPALIQAIPIHILNTLCNKSGSNSYKISQYLNTFWTLVSSLLASRLFHTCPYKWTIPRFINYDEPGFFTTGERAYIVSYILEETPFSEENKSGQKDNVGKLHVLELLFSKITLFYCWSVAS